MIRAKVLSPMLLAASLAAATADTGTFDLKVTRLRTPPGLRNQRGDLHIDAEGLRFRSADGKTNITIPMQNLREADVADPHTLRFQSYDVPKWNPIEHRKYSFRAQNDAPAEELAKFLAAHVHRPVVGHFQTASQFQVPAYHRRALGGAAGVLEIGPDAIRFVSQKPADSRTWLYHDIETIGRPDAFRFRVTTNRETFVLELKADLPEAAYRFVWNRVYDLERSSYF